MKGDVHIAIYHFNIKIVSRGKGASAVAKAAYISGEKIKNEYDGVIHDYRRKREVVHKEIMLPNNAPPKFKNRSVLWNAVEKSETRKNSQTARHIDAALPVEISRSEQIDLVRKFCNQCFVSKRMCADVAVHDKDGHNPHAHIMLTVRALDEKGKWQNKTEKEYLCIRNSVEQGFTASEFKAAQSDGWEKQYKYKVGRKKIYMPPSEAEVHGYERVFKYPKSTRYGRQNPIAARWNSLFYGERLGQILTINICRCQE